ncbi:4'-phosphopantetheinyl transferase family protein [Staphylococcus caprae]
MLNIYVTKIVNTKLSDLIDHSKKFLSEARINKIQNMHYEIDKKRSILSYMLLLFGLINDYSISIDDIEIDVDYFGKPFLVNNDLFFNYSHSGDYIVCAISNKKVGIDIEKYRKMREIPVNLMHKKEKYKYTFINNKEKYFFDIWSLKESYLKYLGIGLSKGINFFYFEFNADFKINVVRNDGKNFYGKIQYVYIDPKYVSSICYDEKKINSIKQVEVKNIYRRLI